jgi:hypothetical protein
MSEPSSRPAGSADASMSELHRLFLEFTAEFDRARGRASPWQDYTTFVTWWQGLDPAIRRACERDFRKGFAAAVAEGEREVADILARYESGGRSLREGCG